MLSSFTSGDDAVAQFEFDTQVTWVIRLNPTGNVTKVLGSANGPASAFDTTQAPY